MSPAVRIDLQLTLPRDEASIPVVRHICAAALDEVSADRSCVHDIEVALTEACANVVEHSGPADEYEVNVVIDDSCCVIRVVDNGHGFDPVALGGRPEDASAEGGRGVRLMQALVDRVQFESKPHDGTIVCLEKQLEFDRPAGLNAGAAPGIQVR